MLEIDCLQNIKDRGFPGKLDFPVPLLWIEENSRRCMNVGRSVVLLEVDEELPI